jgi:acyl carrier protein
MSSSLQAGLTPTESVVAGIWAGELTVAQIAPESNFFELGGDSLVALNVLFLICERFGIEMPAGALMEAPTLREICRRIDLEKSGSEGAGVLEA